MDTTSKCRSTLFLFHIVLIFSSILLTNSIKITCNIQQIGMIETCITNNFTSLSINDTVEYDQQQHHLQSLLISNSLSIFIPKNLSGFLPSLKFFTFVESNIQEIFEDSLSNHKELIELNLQRNKIEIISEKSFKDLQQLKKLLLDSNKISQLDNNTFVALINLQEVYLNDNSLEEISPRIFQSNKKLQIINLEMNQLKSLPTTLFSGLSDLTELYLDHNQIKEIPSRMFFDNKKLEILTISYNQISLIGEENFIIFDNLIKHDFLENPCLIDLTWGYDLEEMRNLVEKNCKPSCENYRDWLLDEIIESSHKREKRSSYDTNQLNVEEISGLKNEIDDLNIKFSQIYEWIKKIDEEKKDLKLLIENAKKQNLDDRKKIDLFINETVTFESKIKNLEIEENLKSIKGRLNVKKDSIFKNLGDIKSLNQTFNDKLEKLKEEMLKKFRKDEDLKQKDGIIDVDKNTIVIDSTIADDNGSGEVLNTTEGDMY